MKAFFDTYKLELRVTGDAVTLRLLLMIGSNVELEFPADIYLLADKMSRDMLFQQCGILTCVDSDELVQPPFKLRNPK